MPEPRTFAAYLDRTERDQLDARAATAEAERDEALQDRDAYKEARDVLRHQLNQAQQRNRDLTNLLHQKRDTISALAAELGDAHDLIAEIRNNRANDDRAFARWETRQTGLGSPRRAQEATETDVPDWVLELIRGLAKYEAEHPKLFRYAGGDAWCPCSLLEGVPKAIREQARP